MQQFDIDTILPAAYEPPVQVRSAKSEEAAIKAGERLFAERGYRGTSMADISAASGTSVGSLYHRFGDKEGLARVIIHGYVSDASALIRDIDLSRATRGDLRGLFYSIALQALTLLTQRHGAYRAAMQLAQSNPDVLEAPSSLVGQMAERVKGVLPDYVDEITAPDPALAVTHAVQVISTIALQTRMGAGAYFPTDTDQLAHLLTNACIGILRPESQGG